MSDIAIYETVNYPNAFRTPLAEHRNAEMSRMLSNVDQYLREISSIIICLGLRHNSAPEILIGLHAVRDGGRCSSWLRTSARAIPVMAFKHRSDYRSWRNQCYKSTSNKNWNNSGKQTPGNEKLGAVPKPSRNIQISELF
jgi:hypothetical protein